MTPSLRVLIVDDEPIARRRLVRLLRLVAGVDVVGEAGDVAITDAAETDAQSRSPLTTGRTRSGTGCTGET